MTDTMENKCEICGEPMPENETMFKYHGYSGPCPKPPLQSRPTPPADAMPTEGGGIGSPEHEMLCGILSRIEFHYLGYRLDDPQTAYKIYDDCYQALRELENFAMELVTKGRALHPPAPVTDAQREDRQMVDELIEYFEHRPQLPRLNGSPFQRVMFDLGAIPENGVKAIIKCLRAALSAPVAQVDVDVLKAKCAKIFDCETLDMDDEIQRSYTFQTIDYITAHYHLTPKTQEVEG